MKARPALLVDRLSDLFALGFPLTIGAAARMLGSTHKNISNRLACLLSSNEVRPQKQAPAIRKGGCRAMIYITTKPRKTP